MKTVVNKNYTLLELFKLEYIEKYLQELVNLSFEYSSNFMFTYNIDSFKQLPIHLLSKDFDTDGECLFTYLNMFNLYLEKDSFFSNICIYLNLKLKIKFNQFLQLICFRGNSSIKNFGAIIKSNLNCGLSFKDFILASFKTRDSIIDSSVNIFSSGYLTRKLIESLRNLNIKELKCTTKYTCKDSRTKKFVNVPILCSNNKAICSFCLNMFYKYVSITGYNKGTISGQALGEPSTQMLLRTFHLGGDFTNFARLSCSFVDTKISSFSYLQLQRSMYLVDTCKELSNLVLHCVKLGHFDVYNNIKTFSKLNVHKFVSLVKLSTYVWNLPLYKVGDSVSGLFKCNDRKYNLLKKGWYNF